MKNIILIIISVLFLVHCGDKDKDKDTDKIQTLDEQIEKAANPKAPADKPDEVQKADEAEDAQEDASQEAGEETSEGEQTSQEAGEETSEDVSQEDASQEADESEEVADEEEEWTFSKWWNSWHIFKIREEKVDKPKVSYDSIEGTYEYKGWTEGEPSEDQLSSP